MKTFEFYITGILDTNLSADEVKRRLVVALVGEDSPGEYNNTISSDEIDVVDYTDTSVELAESEKCCICESELGEVNDAI